MVLSIIMLFWVGEMLDDKKLEEIKKNVAMLRNEGEITKKESRLNPPSPFRTSTLQQEAWRKLRFSARQTMLIAQQLYEGVHCGADVFLGPIRLLTSRPVGHQEVGVSDAVPAPYGGANLGGAPGEFRQGLEGRLADRYYAHGRPHREGNLERRLVVD